MDSKQLVNDIVNKRFSKARKAISEELSNRVLNHIETKRSDVINEALSFEPGLAKTGLAVAAGATAAGIGIAKGAKALHKRFGAVGRAKHKEEKEGKKKEKAEAKKSLAWIKGGGKDVKKLEAKKHKPGTGVELTDKQKKDNQKIQDKIDDIRDKFDSNWAKSHKKDVKAGRIEAGLDLKTAKKQKKKARSERDKKTDDEIKDDDAPTDDEKQAEKDAIEQEDKLKGQLDKEITKRSGDLEKTQTKMNINAILGKDASDKDNQNLATQQSELDTLAKKRAELEPPEEEEEEETE